MDFQKLKMFRIYRSPKKPRRAGISLKLKMYKHLDGLDKIIELVSFFIKQTGWKILHKLVFI